MIINWTRPFSYYVVKGYFDFRIVGAGVAVVGEGALSALTGLSGLTALVGENT